MKNGSGKTGRGVGRRAFVQATLGTTVAGVCSAFQGGAPRQAAGKKAVYRETCDTPIVGRHQVVVSGGGPSGVIAALAAARSGADTLLIERYAFLGGNATAGLMTCYNGFRNQRPPEALQTVKGIPAEYIAELVRLGGVADIDSYERTVQPDIRKGEFRTPSASTPRRRKSRASIC
jgi:NADPH-dependent 2,4-dienoyl-CoA reductase/sulfur reductase-like enzyme